MRKQERRSEVMHTLVVLTAAPKKMKLQKTDIASVYLPVSFPTLPPPKSLLKRHKSGADNYSTRDCEIYCLSRTGCNPLEIHQKSQCCHLADAAREISEDREEDKEEAETGKHSRRVEMWALRNTRPGECVLRVAAVFLICFNNA